MKALNGNAWFQGLLFKECFQLVIPELFKCFQRSCKSWVTCIGPLFWKVDDYRRLRFVLRTVLWICFSRIISNSGLGPGWSRQRYVGMSVSCWCPSVKVRKGKGARALRSFRKQWLRVRCPVGHSLNWSRLSINGFLVQYLRLLFKGVPMFYNGLLWWL